MTSKFSRPAKAAASTLGLLLTCLAGTLEAQTPTATASPSPSPTPHKPMAWVRFWNMVPTTNPGLELVSTADPNKVFATTGSTNSVTDYNELPPGRYAWQVFRTGDRQAPIQNFDVPLRDGSYVTIVVHEKEGTTAPAPAVTPPPSSATSPLVAELVEDTPDPDKPVNQLTVRNYCPGSRVIVTTANRQTTNTLNYGAAQTLTGLPNSVLPLTTRAATRTGARTFHAEADFATNARSTLLIVDDAYGRFSPRLTTDGPPKPTPTPKATR